MGVASTVAVVSVWVTKFKIYKAIALRVIAIIVSEILV